MGIVSVSRKTVQCSQQCVCLNHCSKGLAGCPRKMLPKGLGIAKEWFRVAVIATG